MAYKKEGIKISAVTIQNESKTIQSWDSCYYTIDEQLAFAKILHDKIIKNKLDVKILCWDHNKERLVDWASIAFNNANNYIDGIGFHWYSGTHFNAVRIVSNLFPNKLLWATEFCVTSFEKDAVDTSYAKEVLNDLNCGAQAICEWNLLLDENGGPYHDRNEGCDSPVRYCCNMWSSTIKNNEIITFVIE